jgi:pSer/pThr/pTyr-binding forkhead associated (FHA) protein
MDPNTSSETTPTAYLVDLVSNRKIPISVPRCKAGRDDLNDVVITGDQSISRFHFVISKEGDQYFVQDSKSRHGTFLNGNQITSMEPIKDGDVLKVGVSLFWFVIDSPASAARPSAKPDAIKVEASTAGRTLGPGSRNPALAAASRTSDNMPAVTPESQLADRAPAKEPGPVRVSSDNPRTTSTGLSKLLAQQSLTEQPDDMARGASPAKDELKEASSSDDPDFSDFEKLAEPYYSKPRSGDSPTLEAPEIEPGETVHPSSTTLELFAEAIGEAADLNEDPSPVQAKEAKVETAPSEMVKEASPLSSSQTVSTMASSTGELKQSGGNGANDAMDMVKEKITTQSGPEWCNAYLTPELQSLARELADFNEKVRQAQQRVQEIEDRIAVTKSLRNALLSTQGDELVGACVRVLTYLGWHVKPSAEDRQELQLLIEDKVCIARVVWTNNTPERTHLGQLTISQTRYWCEQGAEPKGILIVSRVGVPPSPPDANSELSEYAQKKNVCLMTAPQLLSLYRDAVLNNVSSEGLRKEIMSSSGWLPGFTLEASTGSGDKQEASTNKLSSLLSA